MPQLSVFEHVFLHLVVVCRIEHFTILRVFPQSHFKEVIESHVGQGPGWGQDLGRSQGFPHE
jgi:hypothetical protein